MWCTPGDLVRLLSSHLERTSIKNTRMPSAKWEIARIGVYITIPIVATCIYAQPDCINFIISRWRYIQYPPQAVTREEYYKKMREVANEK